MDGVISKQFDPTKYQEGIWLCSITDFPQFEGRNYFDLPPEERIQTEDSWGKLKNRFLELMDKKELPIKIELIVFTRVTGILRFLLLKRSPEDGDFWQPMTGTLEINETIPQCRIRELHEETGIDEVVSITDEIYRFSWQKKDYTVVEMVYGVEVSHQDVTLSQEHTEYRWCNFDETMQVLEKENNKKAFLKAGNFLQYEQQKKNRD